MFSESNRYKKKQRGSEISPPQIIILSILVLALGAIMGFGLIFLRNVDKIAASKNPTPTVTPGPTNTPTIAPTATAIPDFSGIEIGIWELPVGFVELSRDEVPIIADGAAIGTALGVPINSQFGYQYTKDTGEKTTLVGFTFVLPGAEEQKKFDQHITDNPDVFEQALHPAEEWIDEIQPEEEFLKDVAEKHTFWRFVRGPEDNAYYIDMLAFRRRGVGAVLYLQYPWQMSPNPDIYTTANLLDQQILSILTKGSMLSSSTIIDPDNVLETLTKAEKRFRAATSITFQLETWYEPEAERFSLSGKTTQSNDLNLTFTTAEGYRFGLYAKSQRGEIVLEDVEGGYLINTGMSFDTMYTNMNVVIYSAAKLSRSANNLRREPDEAVNDVPCFVYAAEIDVGEFTQKTMVSSYFADNDKLYSGTGTARVWINQANFVIQKAHFSIPYTIDEDPEEQGTYEVELIFNAFEE